MKVIIFKINTIIGQTEAKKIIDDLERQVKSGIVFLDNRFSYPPVIVDDTAPNESTKHKECKLCADLENMEAQLKLQEGLQWCGENIGIWRSSNQAYLGYELSAFPITFCPYCGKRITTQKEVVTDAKNNTTNG